MMKLLYQRIRTVDMVSLIVHVLEHVPTLIYATCGTVCACYFLAHGARVPVTPLCGTPFAHGAIVPPPAGDGGAGVRVTHGALVG
jgi:hypothetical protein